MAFWERAWFAADIVLENEERKIWHLTILHDHSVTPGEDYSQLPLMEEPGLDLMQQHFGTPDIAGAVHVPMYGWETLFDDMPKTYETYTDKNSYGPKGNLGKMYYDRIRF